MVTRYRGVSNFPQVGRLKCTETQSDGLAGLRPSTAQFGWKLNLCATSHWRDSTVGPLPGSRRAHWCATPASEGPPTIIYMEGDDVCEEPFNAGARLLSTSRRRQLALDPGHSSCTSPKSQHGSTVTPLPVSLAYPDSTTVMKLMPVGRRFALP